MNEEDALQAAINASLRDMDPKNKNNEASNV
jgi:hypothetical protein